MYLSCSLNPDVALPKNTLTKLQRLSFTYPEKITVEQLVVQNILPSLKYLIVTEAYYVAAISQINNTMIIATSEAFEYPIDLNIFKKLAPILVPYPHYSSSEPLLSSLVREYEAEGFVEYLVKELGYDLNAMYVRINDFTSIVY